jgi:ribA/ribD-fused uncharacterized protein
MPIRFYRPTGAHGFLSNYFRWRIRLDGRDWDTVEHFYQAAKFAGQADWAERIRLSPTPDAAKSLARDHRCHWRPDWDAAVKEEVMRRALEAKFASPLLLRELLSTGDAKLVEDSPTDRFWGQSPDGKGLNRLGELLMELREHGRLHLI